MQQRPISAPPPALVCEAWAIDTAKPIDGGQGAAFVGSGLVLKPAGNPSQLDWLAAVLNGLPRFDDLRIIRPVPARDGKWAVEGWAAWEFLEGAVDRRRWHDALIVSDRFHSVVSEVAWSTSVPGRHPWAAGDAFAWGEREMAVPDAFRPLISRLIAFRAVVDLPCQLVHGDLGGNILFHPELPPAVIDVSPFWRPKRYADAIIVADSVAWAGADLAALEPLLDPVGAQMLCRAILFRLGTAAIILDGDDKRLGVEIDAYEPVVRALTTT